MQSVTYRFSKSPPLLDILSLLSFALFLYPALMALGTGLRWLDAPGTDWIKSYGIAEDVALFWLYLAAAVSCGLLFAMSFMWKSPTRNFVGLDDVGLTTAFIGLRRRWPWRALESVKVEQTGAPLKTAKLVVSGTFGWTERLALLFANALASSSRATIRLPDFFDVPIEEVVASINEYRAAALGEKRAGNDARPAPKRTVVASGQPVIFAMSTVMYRRQRLVEYISYALMLPLVGVFTYLFYADADMSRHELWWPGAMVFGGVIVTWIIGGVLQRRAVKPENNSLSLDASGLTYMRGGQSRRWTWGELSAFKLQYASSKRLLGRQRFITFAAPGEDWIWRLNRLFYGLPKQPPLVIIGDVYESPLDEIAAMLNAYRESVLGGPSETSAPATSAE